MLVELQCDKFVDNGDVRNPIKFNPGLNVVLGDETGSNSIGKSTLLLIIDFVFGGDDYLEKAIDVHDKVGRHEIRFVHEFKGEKFYFVRDTGNSRVISFCNSNWRQEQEWTLKIYRDFLQEKYSITRDDMSFREVVSRYIRVYQRDNLDEKNPLSLFRGESSREATIALMRLCGEYCKLQSLSDDLNRSKKRFSIYRDSVKESFIPAISTRREYRENEKLLAALRDSLNEFDDPDKLQGKTGAELVRIAEARGRLQVLRAQKSKAETKVAKLIANLSYGHVEFQDDFDELHKFFPEINIKKLEEIESFHRQLSHILHAELESEKDLAERRVTELDRQIDEQEKTLASFDVMSGVSTRILKEYAEVERKIETLEAQQKNYDLGQELKENYRSLSQQLEKREQGLRDEIQAVISAKMKEKNDYIYEGKKRSPTLILDKAGYRFSTPDDTGTGTAYKSLVVYDLSVLELTPLPILVHDSILLKNIADAPIEKILQLYCQSGKQVFISLDKAGSYSSEAKKVLEDAAVIRLSSGVHSLFGRSWGDIIKKNG